MKHLTITYDDHILYDGPVNRITWTETETGAIEVRAAPPGATPVQPNFLQQLVAGKP